jgi:hypothetical protein
VFALGSAKLSRDHGEKLGAEGIAALPGAADGKSARNGLTRLSLLSELLPAAVLFAVVSAASVVEQK